MLGRSADRTIRLHLLEQFVSMVRVVPWSEAVKLNSSGSQTVVAMKAIFQTQHVQRLDDSNCCLDTNISAPLMRSPTCVAS